MNRTGKWLPELAVRRPVSIAMLMMGVVVVGFVAYLEIPRQLLPDGFTPPFLYVYLPTQPAPPEDNERNIAQPIEESLSTIRGVHRMRTFVKAGDVGFLLQFNEGTDMDVAYTQVRDRVDRTLPDLPDGVSPWFYVWKYNPNNDPVYWIGGTLPEGVSGREGDEIVEQRLVRRLERIPGVSRVRSISAGDWRYQIEVDDKRASAAGVGTYQLVQRLREDNFSMSAGIVEDGGQRHPVRVVERFDDLERLRALPVAPGIRLSDVATIRHVDGAEGAIYRVNGKPGIIIEVYKDGSANTVDVCNAVRDVVHGDDPDLAGFEFTDFFNQGYHIEKSLENLQTTLMWGALFAVIVLFAFLRRIGMTLTITAAIPASLLVTLVVMYFTGSTLNALSLMGLMLSVGMVVDNSIVVVENIQNARDAGHDDTQAAILGTGEVALAIVVATATTVVVFLPLILMSGSATLSFYLGKVGYPVCISLGASLFVSILFIPMATARASKWFRRFSRPRPRAKPRVKLENTRLVKAYSAALGWTMRRRVDAVIVALLVIASVGFPASRLSETDKKAGNPNDFRLFVNFAPSMTRSEREAYLLRAEGALDDLRKEVGIRDVLTRMGGSWGRARLRVFLFDPDERPDIPKDEIIERAKEAMPRHAGVDITTGWSQRAEDGNSVRIGLLGPDSGKLKELALEVARRVERIEGVVSVQPEADDVATQELQLDVDRELTYRYGMTPLVVGGSVDFSLRGRRISDFHGRGEDTPLYVIGPKEERDTVDDLSHLTLASPTGGPGTPVSRLTRQRIAPTYASISRQDRRTLYEIEITTDSDDLDGLSDDIDTALTGFNMPPGYEISKGDRFQRLQANESERNFALSLAVILVFLLMGILFESFVLPLSILVSIPFAFVGAYWTLYLTGTPFDVMAGIGMVILVGIVVNNAVVLVDLIGQLRREGNERTQAILEAGRRRLRPILMTAMTTICGLMPMAAGTASIIGIPYAPLGRALIGGLAASTVLTLFVVPLAYTLFDDLRASFMHLASWRPGRRSAA